MFLGQYAAVDVFPGHHRLVERGRVTGVRFRETMTGRVALTRHRSRRRVRGRRVPSPRRCARRSRSRTSRSSSRARYRPRACVPNWSFRSSEAASSPGRNVRVVQAGPGSGRQTCPTDDLHGEARQRRPATSQCRATKYLQPAGQPWGDSTTAHVTLTEISVRPGRRTAVVRRRLRQDLAEEFPRPAHDDAGVRRGPHVEERRRAVLTYAEFFVRGLAEDVLLRVRW